VADFREVWEARGTKTILGSRRRFLKRREACQSARTTPCFLARLVCSALAAPSCDFQERRPACRDRSQSETGAMIGQWFDWLSNVVAID
jgi:hypothetical protein